MTPAKLNENWQTTKGIYNPNSHSVLPKKKSQFIKTRPQPCYLSHIYTYTPISIATNTIRKTANIPCPKMANRLIAIREFCKPQTNQRPTHVREGQIEPDEGRNRQKNKKKYRIKSFFLLGLVNSSSIQ